MTLSLILHCRNHIAMKESELLLFSDTQGISLTQVITSFLQGGGGALSQSLISFHHIHFCSYAICQHIPLPGCPVRFYLHFFFFLIHNTIILAHLLVRLLFKLNSILSHSIVCCMKAGLLFVLLLLIDQNRG